MIIKAKYLGVETAPRTTHVLQVEGIDVLRHITGKPHIRSLVNCNEKEFEVNEFIKLYDEGRNAFLYGQIIDVDREKDGRVRLIFVLRPLTYGG